MNLIIDTRLKQREKFFADNYIKINPYRKKISLVIVCHLIESSAAYVRTLNKYFALEYIIPKPKSIDKKYLKLYPQDKILKLDREKLKTPNLLLKKLANIPSDHKIILIDIGGYFSNIGNSLKKHFGPRFLGIIEDTENGYQKYLNQKKLTFPLISVARSPLKTNEDHLVGQSVVFSTESIIREQGIFLNNKKVGVIGFGKIGNGILSYLRDKGCDISVYDNNPTTLVVANAKGYKIVSKKNIIRESEIIFCATGNLSLKKSEFTNLKKGAFIVSVTSSDDELDTQWLEKKYKSKNISQYIKLYQKTGHYFYLLNEGNAINFVHGGGADNFIILVQKEMMDSTLYIAENKLENGLQESPSYIRERISSLWLKQFIKININK